MEYVCEVLQAYPPIQPVKSIVCFVVVGERHENGEDDRQNIKYHQKNNRNRKESDVVTFIKESFHFFNETQRSAALFDSFHGSKSTLCISDIDYKESNAYHKGKREEKENFVRVICYVGIGDFFQSKNRINFILYRNITYNAVNEKSRIIGIYLNAERIDFRHIGHTEVCHKNEISDFCRKENKSFHNLLMSHISHTHDNIGKLCRHIALSKSQTIAFKAVSYKKKNALKEVSYIQHNRFDCTGDTKEE